MDERKIRNLISIWDKYNTRSRLKLLKSLSKYSKNNGQQTIDKIESELGINLLLFFHRLTVFLRLNYLKNNFELTPVINVIGMFLKKEKVLMNFLEIGGTVLMIEIINASDGSSSYQEKESCLNVLINISKMGRIYKEIIVSSEMGLKNIVHSMMYLSGKQQDGKQQQHSQQEMGDDKNYLFDLYEELFKRLITERFIEQQILSLIYILTTYKDIQAKCVAANVLLYISDNVSFDKKNNLLPIREKNVVRDMVRFLKYDGLNDKILLLLLQTLKYDTTGCSKLVYEEMLQLLSVEESKFAMLPYVTKLFVILIDMNVASELFKVDICIYIIWKVSEINKKRGGVIISNRNNVELKKIYTNETISNLIKIIRFFINNNNENHCEYLMNPLKDIMEEKLLNVILYENDLTPIILFGIQERIDKFFMKCEVNYVKKVLEDIKKKTEEVEKIKLLETGID